ncbi:hypothetical protein [Winogradskyella algicola]|uniref:hypothetical protein n=1 Tax=Winogradskyella algicola TaxID=2575815 RepID=UPI0011090103|nr:hypothetical protein [Winogradskyella algicola]
MTKIIQCFNCGVYNKNRDLCKDCGAILSHKKRREERLKEAQKKRIEKVKNQPPGFVENLRRHPFFIYRAVGWILYSSFMVVGAIGAFIAWLVFAIAAG